MEVYFEESTKHFGSKKYMKYLRRLSGVEARKSSTPGNETMER